MPPKLTQFTGGIKTRSRTPAASVPSTPSSNVKITSEQLIRQTLIESQRVTPEQADALISLKTLAGEPILVMPDNFLDMMALIRDRGYDETYQYLTSNRNLSSTDLVFQSPLFKRAQNQYQIDAELLRNKPIETRSDEPCTRCGSFNVLITQEQTRSADEAMTTIRKCLVCNKRF